MRISKIICCAFAVSGVVLLSACASAAATSSPAPATEVRVTDTVVATKTSMPANTATAIPPTATETRPPTATMVPATFTPDATATQLMRDATTAAKAQQATATTQACLHSTNAVTTDWRVVMCDGFDNTRNGWDVLKLDNTALVGTLDITDSKYRWAFEARQGFVQRIRPRMNPLTDFYMTTQVQNISTSAALDYGVVFRDDGNNYYLFQVTNDETFVILLRNEGKWRALSKEIPTSALLPQAANRLSVIGAGSHLMFYLNDKLVYELDDATLSKGRVGVAAGLSNAGDKATVEFDNFEVRVPPADWVRPTAKPTSVPPTRKPTAVPTAVPQTEPPQGSGCNLEPGNAGILVINHFDGLMTLTLLNHEYKLDGHTEQLIQVPGGQEFTVSVSVVGVGKKNFGPVSLNAGECVSYEPTN